ncbi:GNAT family N-acetyltransferase [Clostridium sp. KNHs214]|uniref:GNAT family N-acetyltransferase n=1 Tax=Clostridium sp. KNHs214 TaxID=1540257 RepID=UPI00054D1111|nr:GNAT family N-acetyltransferase [Clostridium sp. KNHs214]
MKIIQASIDDLKEIMHLIELCVKKMNEEGSNQWDQSYPNKEIIKEDIDAGYLFVAKFNNKIIGIVVLNHIESKEYNEINWTDSHGKIIVIHRMAVDINWQRKGVAKELISFSEKFARNNKFTSIRTDTYIENIKMQSMFKKLGYKKVGQVFFNNGKTKPFICFEKVLLHDLHKS